MSDATRAGVELASRNRSPFTIDIHFPTAFIYVNKLIDLRVDMSAQEEALTPDKNYLGAGGVLVALKRIPNLALVVLEYWRNDYRCRAKIV